MTDLDRALRALNEGNVRVLLSLIPEDTHTTVWAKLTVIADALAAEREKAE